MSEVLPGLEGSTVPYTTNKYTTAILFSILAWFSWLLCIAPLVWHVSQRNVAASSLILWIILTNFPLSINAMIWANDDLGNWWDGIVWCDIHTRIQVGAQVSLGAAVAMILRRLAQVMDTRNITVALGRSSKIKTYLIELAWCWVYPLVLILLYIPIQSVRYNIWGIEGCISAYRPNWQSLILNAIWVPITSLVVLYYAVLLLVRLYRYRREFSRLITARNTTRSRFLRLFLMCIIFLVIVVPYSFYPFSYFCNAMATFRDDPAWEALQGNRKHIIYKFPSNGQVHIDKWGQIALGYVVFLLFGTGTDALNTYKKMLLAIGLGRIFPNLYIARESGTGTPWSFISARTWTSTCVSKAKSYFSKTDTQSSWFGRSTFDSSVCSNSIALDGISNTQLRSSSSISPVLPACTSPSNPTLLKRIFTHIGRHGIHFPSLIQHSGISNNHTNRTATDFASKGFSARAWASEGSLSRHEDQPAGVIVFREVHLDEERGSRAVRS